MAELSLFPLLKKRVPRMAEDHYKTLEISRDASPDEVQKAYRKLARKYHPDLNPDDKAAKQKFQDVQRAFEVLNDPSKRQQYDRYGAAFESMGGGGPGRSGGPPPWGAGGAPGFEGININDIFGQGFEQEPGGFADLFRQFNPGAAGPGGATRRRPSPAPQRGGDLQNRVEVPLATAVLGGEVQVTVRRQGGKQETLNVKIPSGIESGKKIRLRGQGEPGAAGGPPGDILIQVHVAPHPHFRRRGKDLEVEVPITLSEAVLGAKIDVPTPQGTITLSIPPNTSSGKRLRIKGHGVAPKSGSPGDLYAEVMIVLPEALDVDDWKLIKQLGEKHPQNPRDHLHW